ncbi:MAG: hypothetical protein AAGI45_12470 [Cyanobacteria bacterium P01_H01_bin.26]
MDRDRVIQAYLQRLLTWETPLSRGTLAAIARDVGITKAELDTIRLQSQSYLTRGRSYLEFGRLNDAIAELTQAATLQPANLDVLHTLASAYSQRYTRQKDVSDQQRALVIAQRCLDLKPDDKEARELIDRLEHRLSHHRLALLTRRQLTIMAATLVAVGVGAMGMGHLPMFSDPIPQGPAPGTIVPGAGTVPAGAGSSGETDVETNGETGDSPDGKTTPVEGPVEDERPVITLLSATTIPILYDYPDLRVEARLSQLGDYDGASYYKLQGVLINDSDQELSQLGLTVDFLDSNGVAIAATTHAALTSRDASLRPDDTHAFTLVQKVTPELDAVRLTVTNVEQTPARSTYVPPTTIDYSWGQEPPDAISFDLVSRSEQRGDPASQTTFNSEWVLVNTSPDPINLLTLRADFYDPDAQLIQSEDIAAIGDDAPLLPGETRPFRVIKPLARDYGRYRVTVLGAE